MLIKACTSSVSVGEGRFSKNRTGEQGLEESQWHLSIKMTLHISTEEYMEETF